MKGRIYTFFHSPWISYSGVVVYHNICPYVGDDWYMRPDYFLRHPLGDGLIKEAMFLSSDWAPSLSIVLDDRGAVEWWDTRPNKRSQRPVL